MGELLSSTPLPMSVVLGLLAAGIYLVSCFRHGHGAFTTLDTLILVSVMGAVTAATFPLFNAADDTARANALQQNLRILKRQVELYKLEHEDKPPLLFNGGFPQLAEATNAKGVPGPRGPEFPYGPYLPAGLPVNPYTGFSDVVAVDTFPPTETTGTGGWLYHQASGRIAADLPEGVQALTATGQTAQAPSPQ